MCTRKKIIRLPNINDYNNIWKMPIQMQKTYIAGSRPELSTKCGKCYECRKERARNWTYKIWLESLSYKNTCFITLTYRQNKKGQNLNKKDLQLFIKRLRKNNKINIKYFGAGEYGEKKGRAHYHLIILGWKPNDIKRLPNEYSKKGLALYTSKIIQNEWGLGRITIQPFAKDEIGYLSLYIGNNEFLEENINKEALKYKKKALIKIQLKHGILKESYNVKTNETYITKNIKIKDMEIEAYKAYKKEYNEIIPKYKMKKQPEFNISSKNMGFENYINKEYYKYSLILEGYEYERPKEYLRKINDNHTKYSEEIIYYNTKELLERKKYAEENYINTKDREQVKEMRSEEIRQWNKNNNMRKLHKKTESIF